MGWFMLVTIPGGLVAFASWLIFLILHRSPGENDIRRNPSSDSPAACNSMRSSNCS